jgi:hypothetical protein
VIARRSDAWASFVLLLALAVGAPPCTCDHASGEASDHACCPRDAADRPPVDESSCGHCSETAAARTSKVEVERNLARPSAPALACGVQTGPRAELVARRARVAGVPLEPAGRRSVLTLTCTLLV